MFAFCGAGAWVGCRLWAVCRAPPTLALRSALWLLGGPVRRAVRGGGCWVWGVCAGRGAGAGCRLPSLGFPLRAGLHPGASAMRSILLGAPSSRSRRCCSRPRRCRPLQGRVFASFEIVLRLLFVLGRRRCRGGCLGLRLGSGRGWPRALALGRSICARWRVGRGIC